MYYFTDEYFDYLLNTSDKIDFYFNIISSSIGIPCNILSIIIFARLMKNKNNMGFLYIWQCSIDICILLFYLLIYRSNITFGIELRDENQFACKSVSILRSTILETSSWIAVLTTFDRFTFVLYGHFNRFRFLKSKRNLTCIIFGIFAILTLMNLINYFYYVDDKERYCSTDITIKIPSDILFVLLRTYLPFTLMIIFNIIMIRRIITTIINVSHQSSVSRKESQFTVAVIAFDLFYFILSFPQSLFLIFYDINFYSEHFEENYIFHAKYVVVSSVTTSLSLCEQTLSFLMYFTFNKLFRKELLNIIGRIFHVLSFSAQNIIRRSKPMIACIRS